MPALPVARTPETPSPEPSAAHLAVVLMATGLTSFLSTYLAASVNLALKSIGTEMDVGPASLSLLASVYLLLTSICLVPFGKLCDTFGPKRTLVFGCAWFTLSNFVVPFAARSFPLLVAFRGLQGIGAAFLMVSNTPIVSRVFPARQRATALGFLSGMVYFGYSVGNFIGGWLTQAFGWRSIFTSAGLCGLLALVTIQALVPNPGEGAAAGKKVRSLDLPGIAFYAASLICLQVGASRLTDPVGIALLVACTVAFILFLRRQWTAADPIYDLRLAVSNPVFAMSNLAVFFNFLATYGSGYLLPLYLTCNRGLSPAEAGRITLFQPLMQIFFSPFAGFLADRSSPAVVASAGMGMISVALLMLTQLGDSTPLFVVYAALILIGIGISFFSAPNTSLIMGAVPENKRGMAAASNSVMRNLGMQFSIILCGCAFLLAMGHVQGIPREAYGKMLSATRTCYAIFAAMCIAGAVISLKRGGPVPGSDGPAPTTGGPAAPIQGKGEGQ